MRYKLRLNFKKIRKNMEIKTLLSNLKRVYLHRHLMERNTQYKYSFTTT